jgi:deazaflavin-dependent oxidoreductase (nitroreductase family)
MEDGMTLSVELARFNRRVTNRVAGLFAGRAPGFSMLIHTGRRSGKTYRTPILTFRDGPDSYRIALTYGDSADWVRNVLAAGGCDLLTRGRLIHLTDPRVVNDPGSSWAPPPVRLALRLVGAPLSLRLRRASVQEK